jgi:hypothetical protein
MSIPHIPEGDRLNDRLRDLIEVGARTDAALGLLGIAAATLPDRLSDLVKPSVRVGIREGRPRGTIGIP